MNSGNGITLTIYYWTCDAKEWAHAGFISRAMPVGNGFAIMDLSPMLREKLIE